MQVSKRLAPKPMPTLEINVIGKTVSEALPDVEAFIDSAVIANLEEVRIVHGVGTGKLRAGIHDYLKKHRNVAEFRLGKYGRAKRASRSSRSSKRRRVTDEKTGRFDSRSDSAGATCGQ